MRQLLRTATTLVAVLLLTGCTGEEPVAGDPPSASPSATPAPETPEEATRALIAAWRSSDREAAAQVADPVAVDALFANEPREASFVGCFTHAGATACELVDARQRSIEVEVRTGDLPRVAAVTFVGGRSALPDDPEAYAAGLVDAWAAWDRDLALRFASAAVVDRLFGFGSADGWTRTMSEGAAGTSFVTYADPSGVRIVLQVSNAAVSEARTQAVTRVLLPGDEGLAERPAPRRPS